MADTENKTNEKQTKKLQSRKFIVWIVTTLIFILILFVAFINDLGSEVIIKAIDLYTWISALYLGANVGQKIADNFINKKDGESAE